MCPRTGVALLLLALTLPACSGPERQWMKVNETYTAEDFRRDAEACRKGFNALDEACMEARGWVSVAPARPTKAEEPLPDTPTIRR